MAATAEAVGWALPTDKQAVRTPGAWAIKLLDPGCRLVSVGKAHPTLRSITPGKTTDPEILRRVVLAIPRIEGATKSEDRPEADPTK